MNQKDRSKNDDENLVLMSLGGDREAFCEIVAKYQNLLCSLAYASIGDVKLSEDIAQEAFVEAWQKLESLREPQKLKSWLCGILRFKVSRHIRKEIQQPLHQALDVENAIALPSDDREIETQLAQSQQDKLLWNTLSDIDIAYREPLVLFYRQEQSVERVARELDLSIDATKQRLSRGRLLMKKAMNALLEEIMEKTKPGAVFTAGVVACLEDATKEAAAAAMGISTAKTSSILNLPWLMVFMASISGFISSFFGLKASLYQARTKKEKHLVFKVVGLFMFTAVLFISVMYGLVYFGHVNQDKQVILAVFSQVSVVIFIGVYLFLTFRMFTLMKTLRAQERIFNPHAFNNEIDNAGSKKRDYISSWSLMGFPLIHFKFGAIEHNHKPAVAWIAGGSEAYGLLFAWGGIAIAPISVGIISVGILTCGTVGFGLLSTGAVALGVIAFGASAIGYKAYASLSALGWESALSNGFSIAFDAAIGPFAYASQVNNDMASGLANLPLFGQTYEWVLAAIAVLVILPSYMHYKNVKKRFSER